MKLADEIKYKLMAQIGHSPSDLLIPNFYMSTFYEMDLFKITRAGLITEFEIKISRSDYKNDFKKGASNFGDSKHDELKKGLRFCNYFYFVVPENLISINEVPEYCGLIYYNKFQRFDYIKKAKKLHKTQFTDYKFLCEKLTGRCNALQGKIMMNNYDRERSEKARAKLIELLRKNNIEIPFDTW